MPFYKIEALPLVKDSTVLNVFERWIDKNGSCFCSLYLFQLANGLSSARKQLRVVLQALPGQNLRRLSTLHKFPLARRTRVAKGRTRKSMFKKLTHTHNASEQFFLFLPKRKQLAILWVILGTCLVFTGLNDARDLESEDSQSLKFFFLLVHVLRWSFGLGNGRVAHCVLWKAHSALTCKFHVSPGWQMTGIGGTYAVCHKDHCVRGIFPASHESGWIRIWISPMDFLPVIDWYPGVNPAHSVTSGSRFGSLSRLPRRDETHSALFRKSRFFVVQFNWMITHSECGIPQGNKILQLPAQNFAHFFPETWIAQKS